VRALIAALLFAASSSAVACGFHDAVTVQRGVMNWAYPESLHVRTAVWQAQLGGRLERSELTYLGTTLLLNQLKAHLAASASSVRPNVTVVLLGPMLWSRYQPDGAGVRLSLHVDGPVEGDVVLVTEAPVVKAIVDERLSVRDALALGVVKLYGGAAASQSVVAWLSPPR
jgi:hypothetical protein